MKLTLTETSITFDLPCERVLSQLPLFDLPYFFAYCIYGRTEIQVADRIDMLGCTEPACTL